VHLIFIDFNKAYDSIRRYFLYIVATEIGIPMKKVRLMKVCLTETYSGVRVGKNMSDMFPIRNGFQEGDVPSPLLYNCTEL
jgi:hypothetical protein